MTTKLNVELDVDGLHNFIIISQRCNGAQQDRVLIHLSNLGCIKITSADKPWFKEFSDVHTHVLNHQMFQTDEMLRETPIYKMIAGEAHALMEANC